MLGQGRRRALLLVLAVLMSAAVESWRPLLPRSPRYCSTACRLSSSSASSSSTPTAASAAAPSPPTSTASKPLFPLPTLMEGDVVEYLITQRQREKGQLPPGDARVLGLGVVNFELRVHPLCQRKADEALLYYDEDQDALDEAAEAIVTRVLSNVSYSQRCIEDRRINPHGEEAEDVFEVEEQLTPGCGPAIRY